jgi:type VI secretion system protein ImpM
MPAGTAMTRTPTRPHENVLGDAQARAPGDGHTNAHNHTHKNAHEHPHEHVPVAGAIAWYGKLPARGDFVNHGLPQAHLRAWDEWLQHGLRNAGRRRQRSVLDSQLRAFTPWRYLAWPDGEDHLACAGVLVPSHDRVGRAFPLTVLQWVDSRRLDDTDWRDIEAALARLSDAALDVTDVRDTQASQHFEALLLGLPPLLAATPQAGTRASRQQPPLALLRSSPGTRSLWWVEPHPGTSPTVLGDAWPPHSELMLDILALNQDDG